MAQRTQDSRNEKREVKEERNERKTLLHICKREYLQMPGKEHSFLHVRSIPRDPGRSKKLHLRTIDDGRSPDLSFNTKSTFPENNLQWCTLHSVSAALRSLLR